MNSACPLPGRQAEPHFCPALRDEGRRASAGRRREGAEKERRREGDSSTIAHRLLAYAQLWPLHRRVIPFCRLRSTSTCSTAGPQHQRSRNLQQFPFTLLAQTTPTSLSCFRKCCQAPSWYRFDTLPLPDFFLPRSVKAITESAIVDAIPTAEVLCAILSWSPVGGKFGVDEN